MKILPNLTPQAKWFTQFTKRIKHMPWIKEITYDDVEYLYEKEYKENPERAAIQYIADHYNRDS